MKYDTGVGWYIEIKNMQIGRFNTSPIAVFLSWLGYGRISMTDLYVAVRSTFHEHAAELIVFPTVFERDQFPRPDNYPRYHALGGDWKMSRMSAGFIKDGPLFSHDKKAIVPAAVFVESLWQRGWRLVVALVTLLGLAQGVFWIVGLI